MKCAVEKCNRAPLDDPGAKGHCILHAPMQDKDLAKFQAAIDEIILTAQDNDTACDFSFCYFPEGYNCHELRKALERDCLFYNAVFIGKAYFTMATFLGKACFNSAAFLKGADFIGTIFAKEADFRMSRIYGDTSFLSATFTEEVYFMFVSISERVDFTLATFAGATDFTRLKTSGIARVTVRKTLFSQPELVKFHHLDLSCWSFLDTDLRRIDFDNVKWGTYPNLMTLLRKRKNLRGWESRYLSRGWFLHLLRLRMEFTRNRLAIHDETHNVDSHDKASIAKVERLYRHLKYNYEEQRDYSRAGDFYYGEMEMKRLQRNWLGRIPFLIYRFLSGYGERYGQAFTVLMGMILLFGAFFMFAGFTDKDMQVSVQRVLLTWEPSTWWDTLKDFAKSLVYSAESMTLFHQPNITFASFWGKLAELAASVLGILQIALFGLALKRRFKR